MGSYSSHSMTEGMASIFAATEAEARSVNLKNVDDSEDPLNSDVNFAETVDENSYQFLDCQIPGSSLDQLMKAEAIYRNHFCNRLKNKAHLCKVGKKHLRPLKLHPNAIIQMATQLAYFMLHQQMPTTYETAQLRQFYNGRSETCRSFTNSTKEWILEMVKPKKDFKILKQKFTQAYTDYLTLMANCVNFDGGFDRHLLALSNLDDGEKCELTEHYTYKLGGAGNYLLSTSCVGSMQEGKLPFIGGCAPFRDDGYGLFTCYSDSHIYLSLWWYENNGTDGEKLGETIDQIVSNLVDSMTAMSK